MNDCCAGYVVDFEIRVFTRIKVERCMGDLFTAFMDLLGILCLKLYLDIAWKMPDIWGSGS